MNTIRACVIEGSPPRLWCNATKCQGRIVDGSVVCPCIGQMDGEPMDRTLRHNFRLGWCDRVRVLITGKV